MARRGAKMPEPEGFALLGEVWRLSVRTPKGGMVRYYFGDAVYQTDGNQEFDGCKVVKLKKPPLLLWAEDLKALYVFPGFMVPKGAFKPGIPARYAKRAQGAVDAFNKYDHYAKLNEGGNTCAVPDYPQPRVHNQGGAYDVVYRSEKWNGRDGERVDYQHHFSKSGAVKLSADSLTRPRGILIRGGRLTVNDRGIVY